MFRRIRIFCATLKIIVVFYTNLLTALFKWAIVHSSAEQTAAQETRDKPILLLTLTNAKELQMNTNTTQNAQNNVTAIANAMNAAHLLAKEATASVGKPDTNELPLIVVRRDVLGHNFLFRADQENREEGIISYWDCKKGSKMQTAPIEFYRNTKPIESPETVQQVVASFSKEFGYKQVHLRARLLKEGSVRKADPSVPGDQQAAMREFADRLVASVTKAIYAALDPQ